VNRNSVVLEGSLARKDFKSETNKTWAERRKWFENNWTSGPSQRATKHFEPYVSSTVETAPHHRQPFLRAAFARIAFFGFHKLLKSV
jgi:hypothetical protein